MSPTVNNFVHDLVAMAKAMEDLPMVQSALTASEAECNRLSTTVMERELTILNLKTEIDTLHSIIRATEEARDSAELLFLECDDAKRTLVRFLEDASKDIAGVLSAVAPIPTPTVEGDAVGVVRDEVKPEAEGHPEQHDDPNLPMLGQSEVDPTSVNTPTSGNVLIDAGTVLTVENTLTEGVSVQPDPTPSALGMDGNGSSPSTALSDPVTKPADASTTDPYADEPAKYTNAWYDWASEMDKKYNFSWPSRKPMNPAG